MEAKITFSAQDLEALCIAEVSSKLPAPAGMKWQATALTYTVSCALVHDRRERSAVQALPAKQPPEPSAAYAWSPEPPAIHSSVSTTNDDDVPF